MAKLSAHGEEIGRIIYTTKIDAYFKDGKILRNEGSGWKLKARVKPGFSLEEIYQKRLDHQKTILANRPALVAYRKFLHHLTGIKNRWKLNEAVNLMPDDPDGVWSEACDGYGDNVSADVDDICKLCDLFKAMEAELKEIKARKETAGALPVIPMI